MEQWVDFPAVREMFIRFHIDSRFFLYNFGEPILNHYLKIIAGEAKTGDCPFMRKMVRYLKERELRTGEVFVLCNRLRKVMKKEVLGVLPAPESSSSERGVSALELHQELDLLFDANLEGVFNMFSDTISKKEREIQEYLEIINQNVLISKTDAEGIITHVTDAFCHITGYDREELVGRSHSILRHPDTEDSLYRQLWETLNRGESWKGRIKNRNKHGETFWMEGTISPLRSENGSIPGYMAVRHDITDRVRSVTDSLTGLSNRYNFDRTLKKSLASAFANRTPFSLILFDIDNFKIINDRYGHEIGDRALLEIASLVKMRIRSNDLFARWGGEEFVVLTRDALPGASLLAERLREKIEQHEFELHIPLSCSFGVTEYVRGDSPESIFRRVDAHLYSAKRMGKNRVATDTGEIRSTAAAEARNSRGNA